MEELADHFVVDTTPSAERPFPKYWIEAMLPARTPRGRPLRHRGQQPSTFHEVLTLVGAGQCVAPVNEHAITYYSHPGVVFVPIEDAHPTEWALVWRSGAATPLGRAFAQAARDYGPATLHAVIGKADQDADLATAKQELGHGAA
jgi:DNA-binding transcriptional LysR family regulator